MNSRKKMKTPKHDYENLGKDLGKLITEKQMAYGDSYGKSGEVLKQLFPNGIPKESYTDALAIVRIVDKLFRIATDPTWGDESPWKDIAGYALLRYADTEGSCKKEKKVEGYDVTYTFGKFPTHISYEDINKTHISHEDMNKKCKGKSCKKDYNDKIEDKK